MPKVFLVLALGASVMGLAFPSAFESYQASLAAPEGIAPVPQPTEASLALAAAPRLMRLAADATGHFRAQARVNGRALPVMVDTGATYVAMSERTARRMGLAPRAADFRHEARTANGTVQAALVRVERFGLGSLRERPVDVLVLRGEALGDTALLGMSFLGQLERFAVADGVLTLED